MGLVNYKKIRALRESRGWDQYELAEIANINRSVVSRLERGLQNDFKLSVIISIAEALGVGINELLASYVEDKQVQQLLVPNLEAVIDELKKQPAEVQHQAAGILRGYLSTIRD
jgi:transcriptional regulator with XRE-family HTH domain